MSGRGERAIAFHSDLRGSVNSNSLLVATGDRGTYAQPDELDIDGDAAPITTNTAESFFALLKRGGHGTSHHVSRQHLSRYCDESSLRSNACAITDAERRELAIGQVDGKPLILKRATCSDSGRHQIE